MAVLVGALSGFTPPAAKLQALELPHLANRVRPGTSNVFKLNYTRRQPDDGWKYLAAAAVRLDRTPEDLWHEVKVTAKNWLSVCSTE